MRNDRLYTLTTCLPMFSPENKPIKARGVFSNPSTIDSLCFSCPDMDHCASWVMPSKKRGMYEVIINPFIIALRMSNNGCGRKPMSGLSEQYIEICPQRG